LVRYESAKTKKCKLLDHKVPKAVLVPIADASNNTATASAFRL
jgi:hypothetical protein